MEQIGSVILDDSRYKGEDLYCDGPVEDEILDIVSTREPGEYEEIIEERLSWPILYHLSHLRENIVSWMPANKNARVLEIGSGCGAITGILTEKYGSVTSVDLSKKRSRINATRHKDASNLTIKIGNFEDIEPDLDTDYDYIFLIGVFEYARGYINSKTPFEDFLNIMKKHLSSNGRIVIAIENQYGLKYFAGCREDHAAVLYEGIADYPGEGVARTFGRNGLIQIFDRCNMPEYHFYYPYPDYKFPMSIYSDEYLPKVGELINNMRNFDNERVLAFDEKEAFDGLIRQNYFGDFSNSFLVILGSKPEITYTKFSNDRRDKYRIRTAICENGEKAVIKYANDAKAEEHIRALAEHYKALSKKYEGSGVCLNKCHLINASGGTSACFDYVEGKTLEEILDSLIDEGNDKAFLDLIDRFDKLAAYNESEKVSDYDLIYSNIMVDSDDKWTIIDYEWTIAEPRSGEETSTRAMLVYMTGPQKRREWLFDRKIPQKYGITEENLTSHAEKEKVFQHEVTGSRRSMYELYELMGRPVLPLRDAYDETARPEASPHVYQVYFDKGNGFSEELSERYTDAFADEKRIDRTVYFGNDVKALRIDPVMEKCVLNAVTISVNGVQIPLQCLKNNGTGMTTGAILFDNNDPHFEITIKDLKKVMDIALEDRNKLTFSAKVYYPDEAAGEVLFG